MHEVVQVSPQRLKPTECPSLRDDVNSSLQTIQPMGARQEHCICPEGRTLNCESSQGFTITRYSNKAMSVRPCGGADQ